MSNITSSDRRVDILNSIDVRLSLLEAAKMEAQKDAENHSDAINELNRCFNELSTTLQVGLSTFNSKFDAMLNHFKLGFIIICTGCTVFITLFGAFVMFNDRLETKFIHQDDQHIEKLR